MIEEKLQQAISQGLKELYDIDAEPKSVTLQSTRKDFIGDFTVVVFPWVKQARKAPQQMAEELGKKVHELLPEVVESNAEKGFLNFVIGDSYWQSLLKEVLATDAYGTKNADSSEAPIVIEYSSPNTNKPLHLGHIRNNLLGWSVAQLLKANGNNVRMVNLVNDRGIHIMKSMLAWMRYGNGETPETSGMKGDHLVGKYYVEFDKHYKKEVEDLMAKGYEEEQAKKEAPLIVEAQSMLKRWEEGDKEMRDLWSMMNGWVYKGFDETYKRLGVGFDKIYYESDTYLLGKELVSKGLEMGVLYKKEDGSVWCDLTDAGLDHKLLLRKDGTSVYMTQDLGTALLRHEDFGTERLVYVVGNEQDYHFQVLKIVMQRLGYQWAENIYHLSYGMVELPNGKMKSREGTVVDADDLISEMEAQAKEMCREKGKNCDMDETSLEALYHTIALGALKYFILKVDPTRNMLFNPAESIDFNGNTGPFIQYTYARIKSIVRKGAEANAVAFDETASQVIGPKEKEVLRLIHDMPSTIAQAAAAYSPAQIANYAYSVAKAFNSFYQDTPILKCENDNLRSFRVALCSAVAQVLKNTMNILGIEVPERM
ncbi:MAG: arginine--tRNA ligase [Bacteroidales bacterium]|nr:arginine--tRNA ligase [Bacteroidales bacterium]